jgi:hypothetical protein
MPGLDDRDSWPPESLTPSRFAAEGVSGWVELDSDRYLYTMVPGF